MWLVIYECRFDVIVLSEDCTDFFALGQEPHWGLHNIQEWIREIHPIYLTWEEASPEFQECFVNNSCGRIESAMSVLGFSTTKEVYDYLSLNVKFELEDEYKKSTTLCC